MHGCVPAEATLTTVATLANFATDTQFEHLPARAVEHAKVVIASTIASAAMGRDIDSAKVFREMAGARGIEWGDIAGKYHALTPLGGVSRRNIDRSLDIVQRFEEAQSVSALTDLL